MNTTPSAIYRKLPSDLELRLAAMLRRAAQARSAGSPATVWFRADDIGVPGRQFRRMLSTFTVHRVPLALALVPTWLTPPRWRALQRQGQAGTRLWGWHQHGWRHHNHEPAGKKQEFGPARSAAEIRGDLIRGRRRLEAMLGDQLLPVFTPPWNRCSADALAQLEALNFKAVSRSAGAHPAPPEPLPDLAVNVDLHTRKASGGRQDWVALLEELEVTLSGGWCGIMLHHQRMNTNAFDFLDILLQHMVNQKHFRIVHLTSLLAAAGPRPLDASAG